MDSKKKGRNNLRSTKRNYFLRKLSDYISQNILLSIMRFKKIYTTKNNININNYKSCSEIYSSIEIEIIPKKNRYGKFINITKKDKKYFHIYLK